MRASGRPAPRRGAFTLIEVLVVVLIILVLMGLLLTGVQVALRTGKVTQTRAEMAQLSSAIGAFKARFNVDTIPSLIDNRPGPSAMDMNPTQNTAAINAFIKRCFPRSAEGIAALTTPQPVVLLEGDEALVFWLAGPNQLGFSSNPTAPLTGTTGRIAPFFDFPPGRLIDPDGDGYPSFADPYGAPYLFFADNGAGNSYFPRASTKSAGGSVLAPAPNFLIAPFIQSTGRFYNPSSHQILSAGRDQTFGINTQEGNPDRLALSIPDGVWSPGNPGYERSKPGGDDLSTFHDLPLGQQ
jgi:prepilin-type N-terminal cleavage/methylation domain-containing protein